MLFYNYFSCSIHIKIDLGFSVCIILKEINLIFFSLNELSAGKLELAIEIDLRGN